MSKFRDKAREIKAAGVADRGNFTPNGVPKRMYQYWLANTSSLKGRKIRSGARKENFCHFWRVVAIWAPLFWLREKATDFVTSKFGAVVMIAAAIVALFVLVTSTIGLVEFLIGVGLGIAVVAVVAALIMGGAWLHENKPKILERLCIAGISLAALGALIALVIEFGWIVFAYGAGILAGFALLVGAVILIGNLLSALRAHAVAKWDERAAEAEDAYRRGEGPDPYARPVAKPAPKWVKAIGNFFSGVGDFFVLLAQVVRVKKWGICPLVEIDTPKPVGYGVPDEGHGW